MTRIFRSIVTQGWLPVAMLVLLFSVGEVSAQLTSATVSGTVTDQSGAAVPGATITATNTNTGLTRTTSTGIQGRYEIPNIPVGPYEVAATSVGFQTSLRAGVQLSVGQTVLVNHVLQVGEVTQQVTVTGEVALLETRSATVSAVVTTQKVEDLPLNNRDLTQLTFLQPGVLKIPSSGDQSEFSGMGDKLSVAGGRGTHNLYLLDGVSAGDISNNAQSASGAYSGAETVAEFQIITNNYSAEYQSAPGAIVSAITKSGTNAVHGSLFEYIRNDNMDAANFFDNSSGVGKGEFKRNQFGGAIGGPIVPDQTFFFGSYEGLRERLNQTDFVRTISADARQGIIPGEDPFTVNPLVVPYLNLYPVPGQGNTIVEDFEDGTVRIGGGNTRPTTDDYVLFKVDHSASDNHQISGTFNWQDTTRDGPCGILCDVNNGSGTGGGIASTRKIVGFSLTSIFSPTTVNEFNFGFSQTEAAGDIALSTRLDELASLSFSPLSTFMGQVNPGDASSIGFRTQGSTYFQETLSFKEAVSISSGNHSWRFGGEATRFFYDQQSCSRGCNGIYDFDNLIDFLRDAQGNRLQVMIADPDTGVLSPPHLLSQWSIGTYVQDNWQISPTLTLNLGMRYEFTSVPGGDEARTSFLVDLEAEDTTVGPPYENDTALSFSPRFGFAWAPGDQKTSIRAGFGIFYEHPRLYHIRTSLQELPPFVQVRRLDDEDLLDDAGVNLLFPNGFGQLGLPGVEVRNNLRAMEFQQKNTYIHKWSLNLQREIADFVFSAGYTGSRGLHLLNQNRLNLRKWEIKDSRDPDAPTVAAFPVNPEPGQFKFFPRLGRIVPNFGEARMQLSNANTFYHGLEVGIQKRLSYGMQVQVAYTWSKTIDQGAGVTSGGDELPQSQRGIYGFDHQFKRGLSNQDLRHSFVSNYSYDFPRGDFGGAGNALVNGWQLNGIVTLTSGHSLYVRDTGSRQNSVIGSNEGLRPDLIAGGDQNPVLGGPDHYFDERQFEPSLTGFFGNLGKGTITSPGIVNFDMSFIKDFEFGESKSIQFRAEFFNMFNRANFGDPDLTIFRSSSRRDFPGDDRVSYDRNAGTISRTTTANRQVQFALKFIF
jgi:hypothetical protein